MTTRFRPTLIAAAALTAVTAMAGLLLPLGAQASEADLLKRIEALSKELEQLKTQVQAGQQKATQATEELKEQVKTADERSMSNWLYDRRRLPVPHRQPARRDAHLHRRQRHLRQRAVEAAR